MAYPVMPFGFLGSQGDNDSYQIQRSLRFNGSTKYLTRTIQLSATTNTWSFWVKRSSLGSTGAIYGFTNSINTTFQIAFMDSALYGFGNTDSLIFGDDLTSARLRLATTQVFRDTSAWYHFVVVLDTTQATASDRAKIYVNGSQITSFTNETYPTQNTSLNCGGSVSNGVGALGFANAYQFNGYLAEINVIQGQALTPSSFGETDAITGRWKAKAYSGTYGTNGFYLKFADNSGTTSTTLGKDSSPNGNNWTPNNFSVDNTTSNGINNDSLVESPTNYGTDTGLGGEIRGNYCTFNPLKRSSTYANLSNGNLTIIGVTGGAGQQSVQANIAMSSGKWYAEAIITTVGAESSVGIARATQDTGLYVGNGAFSYGYYLNGQKYNNSSGSAYGASYTSGDVIGVAFDADAGNLVFYKNGTSQGTAFTGLTSGPYVFEGQGRSATSGNQNDWNFGQRPWKYTAPTGFKALCTTNLPTPTIKKPSSYMDVVTYTGTGATQTISSLGFSPDLLWTKGRSLAQSHNLFDTVRSGQRLRSDTTDADASTTVTLGSNGFTLGTETESNNSGSTFVAWAWDAGSSSVTNTSGSITSTVRANPQNGVSIVGYTGNGTAGATVGHGLGVSPSMVITKKRSTATSSQWTVGFSALGWNKYVLLNSTAAAATDSNVWNSAPTSSVFYLGNDIWNNHSGQTTIAYCFAEVEGFSKFGSYTGNASANGPFVWCGFRPRWVMVKASSTGGAGYEWLIFDTARSDFNLMNKWLLANSSQAETTDVDAAADVIDGVSSGFKLRGSDSRGNANGVTYIFAAFAESPFKYARAR